mgnify:CR=1 FL=1
MEKQDDIKRTPSLPGSIEAIRGLLGSDGVRNRSALAEAACKHFGFFDARGRSQSACCGKALRELERAGHFVLPAASDVRSGDRAGPRRLDAPVEAPEEAPEQAAAVQGLTLIKVASVDQMRVWNELMLREHLRWFRSSGQPPGWNKLRPVVG